MPWMTNDNQRKNIFLILGVPRSGTSVISKGLNSLGIDFGNKLIKPGKWNPTGFFEDYDVVFKVNHKVLATFGLSWDSLKIVDEECQISEELESLHQVAVDLLMERFADTNFWGFKDPQTSRIVPFWEHIFERLNIQSHYIIALRNPLSSAHSFGTMTGNDIEKGLILWLVHLIPAIKATHHKKRVFVSYDAMLNNPRFQLERLHQKLGLNLELKPEAINNFANEFLNKKLHHHEYTIDNLKNHPAISIAPLCLKAYRLLVKLAQDELSCEDETFITAWQEIINEFEEFSMFYNYVDSLQQKITQLEKSLHRIHKSRLWKMIAPLRNLNDMFREKRNKKRVIKEPVL